MGRLLEVLVSKGCVRKAGSWCLVIVNWSIEKDVGSELMMMIE